MLWESEHARAVSRAPRPKNLFSGAEIRRGVDEKLSKLLELRESQASGLYHRSTFSGTENSRQYLYLELEESPGTIDPKRLPYYLMLVGSPEEIPFEIQYALSVNHAVGRLYFEDVEAYTRYALSVVEAEGGMEVHRPRRVDLFAVGKPGDTAGRHMAEYLIGPLARSLPTKAESWKLDLIHGEHAKRSELLRLLGGGPDTPSLLIAACR